MIIPLFCLFPSFLAPVLPAQATEDGNGAAGAGSPAAVSRTGKIAGSFGYRFSAEFLAGWMSGTGLELVYRNASQPQVGEELISRLDWEMKDLFYLGLELDFVLDTPIRFFSPFIRLRGKTGLSGKTGHVEDRDWLGSGQSYLTHFSRHDSFTTVSFFADGDVGFLFSIGGKERHNWGIGLGLFARFSWLGPAWEGRDGYTQHAFLFTGANYQDSPWDEGTTAKVTLSGPAFNYSQDWFIIGPGISLEAAFLRHFSLGLVFTISPFISCTATDHHFSPAGQYTTYDLYTDRLAGGLYLKPEAALEFSPVDWLAFTFHLSYTLISGPRGSTEKNGVRTANESGAGFNAWDTGFGIKLYP